MELDKHSAVKRSLVLTALLISVALFAGCRSAGGSKWSFGHQDKEKNAQLATYKENEKASQADGNIIPPADQAKPAATTALGQHRLADSGYPAEQIPGYTPSEKTNPVANSGNMPNYAPVEQLASQATAAADRNATPVAYSEENIPPLDPNAFPANVPAMVSSPSQPVASAADYANAPVSSGSDLPPLPGDMPSNPINQVNHVSTAVSAPAVPPSVPSTNATLPGSYNYDSSVVPAGMIPQNEIDAFTPAQTGTFLPGSIDVNRYQSEYSQTPAAAPGATTPAASNNLYPTAPSAPSVPASAPLIPSDAPPVPGFSSANPAVNNLPANVDYASMRTEIPEAAFCMMSYHQVADLVSGKGVEAEIAHSSAQGTNPEFRGVNIIQTSMVKPAAPETHTQAVAVEPESIAESTPPILMNLAPLN